MESGAMVGRTHFIQIRGEALMSFFLSFAS
jgi:hypothetical protein